MLIAAPVIAFFCTIYVCLWFGVEYDDVRRMFVQQGPGLSDDIFDKCKLESAPLWNLNILKWMNPDYDPMKSCNHSWTPWSELQEDGRVQMTSASNKEADCRARAVLLKNEYRHSLGPWHAIKERFVFENDIVEVECKIKNKVVYNFVHYQIWEGKKKKKTRSARKAEDIPPSVHIVVLDSIGASHGRRVFDHTQGFLKKEFGAVEILHLNKVGENSRPNGIALLFGKLIGTLKRAMYGMPTRAPDWNRSIFCNSYLDNRGFVLKQFEKKGYKTMMAEDWDKGVFNWPGCHGFEKQPTTHYMRPFQLRMKDRVPAMREAMSNAHCFEPHLQLNEYHEKFINAYPDKPKAVLTWASYLGHDRPNLPFHSDKQYKAFFKRNREEFDNSFVFFLGDHGLRFGWYTYEPSGRRDMDNPMLMISVPRRLREDAALMANLKHNSRELLTHFDTHATFIDIIETIASKKSTNFSRHAEKYKLETQGSSILRPLPAGERNCKTLPIPPQYCLCEIERQTLNVTDDSFGIGDAIASIVNERLAEANVTDVCAEIELDEVTELKQIVGAHDLYDVTVKMRPGGGVFQTFVRGSDGDYSVVVPDVTRLNKYGKQAKCTLNNEIRPLCYCKSNLLPTTKGPPSTQKPKAKPKN